MNIGEYRTVRANTAADLDKNVNAALADGFQLYGNPYVTGNNSQVTICQAMVKEAAGTARMVPVSG